MKKFLKYFLIFLGVVFIISLSFANGNIPRDEVIDKLEDSENKI
jgi:hypothetical protein